MDFEALFRRYPLGQAPLSLVIRPGASGPLETIVDRAVSLLANRHRPDQIVLLLAAPPPRAPRSRQPWIRVDWVVHEDGDSGAALAQAIAACSRPVVVLCDPEVSLLPGELRDLVHALQAPVADPEGRFGCDLVAGSRARSSGWWQRVCEAGLRWLFGVPVADPLCPWKAIRAAAIRGVPLQTRGALRDFEIIAKLNYMTCLVDELPVPRAETATSAETADSVLRTAFAQGQGLTDLFLRPRFWSGRDPRPGLADPPPLGELAHSSSPWSPAGRPRSRISLAAPAPSRLPLPRTDRLGSD